MMKMWNDDRRYGRLRIDPDSALDYEQLAVAFAGFIPLRVEHLFIDRQLECAGYHPDFDPVPIGSEAPLYQAVMVTLKDEETGEITGYERQWLKGGY